MNRLEPIDWLDLWEQETVDMATEADVAIDTLMGQPQ